MKKQDVLFKSLLAALVLAGAPSCSDDDGGIAPPQGVVEIGDNALSEKLLQAGVDANGDGYVTEEEMAAVRTLDLSWKAGEKISVITGLEYFTSLEELNLDGNTVRSLTPLSGISTLRKLSARDNGKMIVGDLSKLLSLEEIDLSGNDLTGKVEQIEGGGQMNSLDLKANVRLRRVTVDGEASLDCIVANYLASLEEISAAECSSLLYVYAGDCPKLREVDVHGSGNFVMPWLTGSKALETLDCTDCSLYSTEYQALFQEEQPALRTLLVGGNNRLNDNGAANFRELNFALLPALEELDVTDTRFVSLDLSANKALKTLRAERMPLLESIDLRNDAYPAGADYRIVEGNPALKLIVVDDGAEKEAVEALVGGADITVTTNPNGGGVVSGSLPVPAPAEGSDEDQSPKSIGAMMWYPQYELCGKTLEEVKNTEPTSMLSAMTVKGDGYAIYYYAVSDDDIKLRAYRVDDSEKVESISSYVVTRSKLLVKKDGAWVMNPNFKPSFPVALESLGEADGAFVYKGAPWGASYSYRIAIRAVLLDDVEYAELTYTVAQ